MPLIEVSSWEFLVLDNDVFTHWRNGQLYVKREIDGYVDRFQKPPALTSAAVFEALYGIEHELSKDKITEEQAANYHNRINQLIQPCEVLSFDSAAAEIAAYICANVGKSNYNKHWNDIFIAATALAHGHGVATQNKKDFELIANHLPQSHQFLSLAVWKQ